MYILLLESCCFFFLLLLYFLSNYNYGLYFIIDIVNKFYENKKTFLLKKRYLTDMQISVVCLPCAKKICSEVILFLYEL